MQLTPKELLEIIELHDEKKLVEKADPTVVHAACENCAKELQNLDKSSNLTLGA